MLRSWYDSLRFSVFSVLQIIGDFTLSTSVLNFLIPIPTATIFYAFTAALNILLTGLIVGKIVLHTRSIAKSLGTRNRWPSAVISMMIESSALFSISTIATAITWGNNASRSQTNANLITVAVASQMTVSVCVLIMIMIKLVFIVDCSNSHRIPYCNRHIDHNTKAWPDSNCLSRPF